MRVVLAVAATALAIGGSFGATASTQASCTFNVGRCYNGNCYVNVGTCSGGSCTVTVGTCYEGQTDLIAL